MSWTKTAKETVKDKGLLDKDSDYGGMVGKALNELIDVFGKQGHSGFSALLVSSLFRRLVKYDGFFDKKSLDKAMKAFMKKEGLKMGVQGVINMVKTLSRVELRQKARQEAMPEVKKMVAKHGRTTLQSCLNTIREHEKKAEKLESLKGEVKKLEKEL